MHFIPAYVEKLTPGQRKFVNKRVQKYSKQTQYCAHTFNPKRGHRLPFCIKFPKISEYFKIIDRKHPWANHHEGICNGMLFVPAEPDQTSFEILQVFCGIINKGFRESPEYKLLLHLKKFCEKIRIRSQIVTLVREELDFAVDPNLAEVGTFFNIYHNSN